MVRNANSASKHFGDLKYWAIDSAVTQLDRSQQRAEVAKAGLDSDLKAISAVDPAAVAAIGAEVYTMTDLARQAGSPTQATRAAPEMLSWRKPRAHVMGIEAHLDKIVDRVEQQALARRDMSMRQAEFAVKLAIVGGIGALALALGFTAFTVHSITAPLKQLDREHRFDHAWRTERRNAALRCT